MGSEMCIRDRFSRDSMKDVALAYIDRYFNVTVTKAGPGLYYSTIFRRSRRLAFQDALSNIPIDAPRFRRCLGPKYLTMPRNVYDTVLYAVIACLLLSELIGLVAEKLTS